MSGPGGACAGSVGVAIPVSGLMSSSVPSGAFKLIFEPMVRLVQTMHLSCVEVNTITKRTDTSLHFESQFPTAIEIQSSLFIQVSLIRGFRIDALAYIYQPPTSLEALKSFEKIETLIILRAPPYSRAKLVRLGLEGGKQASLGFLIVSRAWFGIILIPPLVCISIILYAF